MNSKTKTLLSIGAFAVIIIIAAFAYNILSRDFISKSEEKSNTIQNSAQQKAPDFNVIDSYGKEVKLSDYFGRPIVLNFWASWCPPCKSEMPEFNRVYNEVKDDITFLMVDMTDGTRETVDRAKKYILDSGFTFPILFDTEQDAAYTYNVSSIPSTLFINKDGNIVASYQGAINEKTLLAQIQKIK